MSVKEDSLGLAQSWLLGPGLSLYILVQELSHAWKSHDKWCFINFEEHQLISWVPSQPDIIESFQQPIRKSWYNVKNTSRNKHFLIC